MQRSSTNLIARWALAAGLALVGIGVGLLVIGLSYAMITPASGSGPYYTNGIPLMDAGTVARYGARIGRAGCWLPIRQENLNY